MGTEAVKGNAVEVGNITTDDGEGGQYEYKFALLIEFKSAEDIRAAMQLQKVEFTVFGE